MSSDRDMTFSGDDEADAPLHAMYEALPDFEDSDPVSLIAGVLFLDQRAGKLDEVHHLLMQPGLFQWLPMYSCIRFDDPEVAALIPVGDADEDEATDVPEPTEAENALLDAKLVDAPTPITFTSDNPEIQAAIPEILRGKTVLLQVMSIDQATRHDFFIASVRADGRLVDISRRANEVL